MYTHSPTPTSTQKSRKILNLNKKNELILFLGQHHPNMLAIGNTIFHRTRKLEFQALFVLNTRHRRIDQFLELFFVQSDARVSEPSDLGINKGFWWRRGFTFWVPEPQSRLKSFSFMWMITFIFLLLLFYRFDAG